MKKILSILVIILMLVINITNPIVNADQIDQQQLMNEEFVILHGGRPEVIPTKVAQTFKPSLPTITRIALTMRKHGNPTGNMILELRQDSITGALVASKTEEVSSILSSKSWIEFDITDEFLILDSTYALVLTYSGGDMNNYIEVGGTFNDNYIDGFYSYYVDNEWFDFPSCDLAFKTYGITTSNLPPDCPYGESATVNGNSVTLKCTVTDPDDDHLISVIFFNSAGENDIIEGWDYPGDETESGTTFSYTCSGLDYDTTYEWHCLAFDGEYEIDSESSDCNGELWSFKTGPKPEDPNNPPSIPKNPNPDNNVENVDINEKEAFNPNEPYNGMDEWHELGVDLEWYSGD